MTQIIWTRNDDSGRFVERQLRALQAYIETCPDDQKLDHLKSYVYVWDMKARIAKTHELEQRIAELEKLAGLAQKGVITT